jgi:hypothetical protein
VILLDVLRDTGTGPAFMVTLAAVSGALIGAGLAPRPDPEDHP